jgi:hypothetical protein
VAVGLVQAEHEGVGDAVLAHQALELVVVADHSVDVAAEMKVGVEDLGACREHALHLPVIPAYELESSSQCVAHPRKASRTG